MTITVACISDDIEYATRMVGYMKSSPIYHSWRLQLFTSLAKFQPREAYGQLDLILVDEVMYDQFTEQFPQLTLPQDERLTVQGLHTQPIIVQLVSQPTHIREHHKLVKYQPLSTLLHMLYTIIEGQRHTASRPVIARTSETIVVGVGSSIAQCGKTIFALHLTHAIASRNERVFYFNLELWNTSESWMSTDDPTSSSFSYSDFLYAVKSNAEEAQNWFAKHRQYDQRLQCDRLKPFIHIEDRQQLSKEDAQLMLNIIRSSGHYDYIVLDLSANYDEWNLTLLAECDIHYMMMMASEEWMMKHQMSIQYARMKWKDLTTKIESNAIVILNESRQTRSINNTELQVHFKLPHIDQWEEQYATLLSSSIYRATVEHCAHKFLNKGSYAS